MKQRGLRTISPAVVVVLASAPPVLAHTASAVAPRVGARGPAAQEIRSIYTDRSGLARPNGVAWDPARHALVVTGPSADGGTEIVFGHDRRASARLDRAAGSEGCDGCPLRPEVPEARRSRVRRVRGLDVRSRRNTARVDRHGNDRDRLASRLGRATVKNTGRVRFDLGAWVLVNRAIGVRRELPSFRVRPGRVVRIHSGSGVDDSSDLYLGRRGMWGERGAAVLRNNQGVRLDRFPTESRRLRLSADANRPRRGEES